MEPSTSPLNRSFESGKEAVLENLVRTQHIELMRRLSRHEDLLSQLLVSSAVNPVPVANLAKEQEPPSLRERLSQYRTVSCPQEEMKAAEATASAPTTPPFVPVPLRPPSAAKNSQKLRSTTEDSEEAIREAAARHQLDLSRIQEQSKKFGALNGANQRLQDDQDLDSWSMRLIKNPYWDVVVGVLIVANTMFIGFEVEMQVQEVDLRTLFFVIGLLFTFLFFVELLIRILAWGPRLFVFGDQKGWNILDSFLVLGSLADVVVSTMESSEAAVEGIVTIRLARIFRITRVMRLLRIARIIHYISPLNVLLHSIFATLKAMVWAMLLLLVDLYFFSIVFTQVTHTTYRNLEGSSIEDDVKLRDHIELYWDGLGRSMMTLLQVVTGGIDWDIVARPIGSIHVVWMLTFVAYFILTTFALFNVITGFFCQAAIREADHDRDLILRNLQENKSKYINNIRSQFKAMFGDLKGQGDGNGGAGLSLKEFERHIYDDKVAGFFLLLDIDIADAWTLFNLLDSDETGHIDAEEFVDGCLRLRGPAKGIDLAMFSNDTRRMLRRMGKKVENAQRSCQELAALATANFMARDADLWETPGTLSLPESSMTVAARGGASLPQGGMSSATQQLPERQAEGPVILP